MSSTHAPIETETISKGQVSRLFDRFEAKCLKGSLPKKQTQDVLEEEGDALVQDMFDLLRVRVERRSETITRHVTINRNQPPDRFLSKVTNRSGYIDEATLATMPIAGLEEVDIVFFRLGKYVSVDDLDREYESRGLKPDHYAQAQVNIDDPSFVDEHPNGSQWRDHKGRACCLTFRGWGVGRGVYVDRSDYGGWDGCWWFAGVRK